MYDVCVRVKVFLLSYNIGITYYIIMLMLM